VSFDGNSFALDARDDRLEAAGAVDFDSGYEHEFMQQLCVLLAGVLDVSAPVTGPRPGNLRAPD